MTVTTNTTDRKALVKALADKLGTTAKYMGPPTFGYQVGDYIVDRDGNIEGEDFEALRDFLQSIGCFPEEETEPAGEQTEPETETDNLIARLMENTPETMEDFKALLDAAKEDGLTGFEFAEGKVTLTYAAHQDEPERNMLYAMLTARILKAAKEATRVFPERQEPENEKYFARAWLLRIGYNGADSKAERNLLLKHLKGHSAFPNDEAAEKHKTKYAEIRKEKRQAAQEVTSND